MIATVTTKSIQNYTAVTEQKVENEGKNKQMRHIENSEILSLKLNISRSLLKIYSIPN